MDGGTHSWGTFMGYIIRLKLNYEQLIITVLLNFEKSNSVWNLQKEKGRSRSQKNVHKYLIIPLKECFNAYD